MIKLILILSLLIEFVSSASQNCQGSFKAPTINGQVCGQKFPCTYQAFWQFRPEDDSIEFILISANTGDSRWTGIGFTQDPENLTNVDFIFAWTEGRQRYVMMDAFLPSWGQAIPDKSQNIEGIKVSVTDYKTFKFSRKRKTLDQSQQDLAFADEKCHYMVFASQGGNVMRHHNVEFDALPDTSAVPICIRACDYEPSTTATSTTSTTSRPPAPAAPLLSSTTSTTRAPTTKPPAPATTTTTTTTTSTTTTPKPAPTRPPKRPSTTTTTTTTTTSTTTTSTTTTTTPAPSSTQSPSSTTAATAPTSASTTTTTTTPAPPTSQTPPLERQTVNRYPAEVQSPAASDESLVLSATNPQQWCIGRWSYPARCRVHPDSFGYVQRPLDGLQSIEPIRIDQGDCTYYSQWQYHEASDSIEFIIQTKSRNRWTGIGFSNSTHMANADAIIGLFDESLRRHFIMDTWLQNHTIPELDQEQNIDEQNQTVVRKHQTTTFRFKRKRITGDPLDFQFTDDSCAHFFFPVEGGAFNFVNKRIQRHQSVPIVSKQRICIKSCNNNNNNKDLKYSAIVEPAVVGSSSSSSAAFTPSQESPDSSSSTHSGSTGADSSASSAQPSTPPLQTTNTPPMGSSGPATTTVSPPGVDSQPADSKDKLNLSNQLSNDLQVDLDGHQSNSASSASSESHHGNSNSNNNSGATQRQSPLNKFAFLSEPSLRWLAGIGCVATLLAVIVFQACFTVYKNKQAYKQNLYRQSAFKQSAYLHHEPYLSETRHQPSTGSEETQTTASLRNSSTVNKPNQMNSSSHHHLASAMVGGGGGGGAVSNSLSASQPTQLNSRSQLYRLSMAPYQLHRPQQQPHQLPYEADPFEQDDEEDEDDLEEELEDELEEVEDEEDEDENDIMMDARLPGGHYAPGHHRHCQRHPTHAHGAQHYPHVRSHQAHPHSHAHRHLQQQQHLYAQQQQAYRSNQRAYPQAHLHSRTTDMHPHHQHQQPHQHPNHRRRWIPQRPPPRMH